MIRFFLILVMCCTSVVVHADDWRAYHHGINFVPDGHGRYWVFYSGVADASRDVGDEEEWHEHIYVANWGAGEEKITPRLFIKQPGAQEPVSAARNTDGHIMIVAEDSGETENDVDERFGLYDSDLKPLKPYPQQVADGGHSGHVAASGNRFTAVYSEGWIDGGGEDNLGSGYGIYAKIYDSSGVLQHAVKVAPRSREWWPMIASSPTQALLVWQAYVKGQSYARLKAALLDVATGNIIPVPVPDMNVKYYTYSAAYMPALNRFLVVATTDRKRGFGFLVDAQGRVAAVMPCMPPVEREAGIAIDGDDAYLPVAEDQMMRLHATATTTGTTLALTGIMPSPFSWAEEGSIGLPITAGRMHWVSLDRYGLQEADFAGADMLTPSPRDFCR